MIHRFAFIWLMSISCSIACFAQQPTPAASPASPAPPATTATRPAPPERVPYPDSLKVRKGMFKIYLMPGLEFEGRLGPRTTIDISAYLLGYQFPFFHANTYTGDVQLRNYYNLARRHRRGKRYKNNSGGFIYANIYGGEFQRVFSGFDNSNDDLDQGLLVGTGVGWGFQRTYGSGIYISGVMGLSVYTTGEKEYFMPGYKFKVGYAFNSRTPPHYYVRTIRRR